MRASTMRQEQILQFIESQIETGVPPTIREIAAEFDIRSPNGVMCHLRSLRKLGLLDWTPGAARSLRVPRGLPLVGRV